MRRTAVVLIFIFAIVVATLASGGAAFASWNGTSSAAGASSQAAALPAGPTPGVSTGYTSAVTVSWSATTLSNGAAAGGYLVRSFDTTTHTPRTVGNGCSGTITALTCTETGVADGRWSYTVTPTIGTNWVGSASGASVTRTVDTVAPASATLNALPSTVRNGQVLSGSGADATSGVASIAYLYCTGGTCAPNVLAGTGTTASTYPVTWSTQPADGSYRILARVVDAAGYTKDSAIQTVTIDNTAPAVTLTTPAGGALTTDNTPSLGGAAGNAAGDATPVTVRIYSGTGTAGAVVQTLTPNRGGGSWSTTAATLADGTYTAQASQTDAAGNVGTSTANTFTVDTTGPAVIALTNGPHDGTVDAGDTLAVTFGEALNPTTVPANGTLTFTNGSGNGNDTFSLSGVTNGSLTTGVTGWVRNNRSVTYSVSYSLGAGNTQVTATVGTCTSGCSNAGTVAGAGSVAFAPASTLKDPAGNPASGIKTVMIQLF
jgi:hypothetical protein